jgi:hypothetical protein
MKTVITRQPVQGEGDYQAARRHRDSVQTFVKSGKVDQAAHAAEPETTEEAEAMQQAEIVGEAHSKGEDPSPKRSPARKS